MYRILLLFSLSAQDILQLQLASLKKDVDLLKNELKISENENSKLNIENKNLKQAITLHEANMNTERSKSNNQIQSLQTEVELLKSGLENSKNFHTQVEVLHDSLLETQKFLSMAQSQRTADKVVFQKELESLKNELKIEKENSKNFRPFM